MSESITPREQEIRNLLPWYDHNRGDVEYLLRLLDIERAQANRTAAGAWDHGYQAHQDGVQRYHNPHVPHDSHGACPDWCTPLADPA